MDYWANIQNQTAARRVSAARRTAPPKPRTVPTGPGTANRAQFEDRENFISQVRRDPTTANIPIYDIYSAYAMGPTSPQAYTPAVLPQGPGTTNTGSGSGSRRRSGGGGGGGVSAAQQAQSQLDFLLPLLGSKSYTARPETAVRQAITDREGGVNTAYTNDMGTLTGAYDKLDAWLAANQRNPFADLKFQRAQVAPDQNRYLTSQGVQGLDNPATNPDDAYGGFSNAAALLNAGTQQSNQSQLAGSQMGRAGGATDLGAQRNAFLDMIKQQLAQLAQQEYTNQQTLDTEKRQAALQLAPLIAQGAKAPADILALLGMA